MSRTADISVAAPFHRRALVAFTGATDLWWLRLLRPGFRHCFVALHDGERWITCDPLSHRLEIAVQPVPANFDLAAHYRDRGLTVIEVVPPAVPLRSAPVRLFTCVETVKRALGLRAPGVLTPWQLFRYLRAGRHLVPARRFVEAKKAACDFIHNYIPNIAEL